jgi:hypothetical protein
VNSRRTARTAIRALAVVVAATVFGAGTADTSPPPEGDDTSVASTTGTFAVQPSGPNGPGGRDYFVYTLRPGQVFGDIVGVSNLSDETLTFAVYPTDAFNTPDAGFGLLREEELPVGLGTWVELGATQYTLDPGERVDIPFSVTVPADASPGDHAGAIVAQVIPEGSADQPDDGIGFDVRLRIGARIYVRVDGPLSPSLTIEQFRIEYVTPLNPLGSDSVRVTYVVANTGNTRLQPTASLKVAGLFGLGSTQAPLRDIPELLPGSSLEIAEIIRDVRPLGRLTATLRLQAPLDGVDVERSVSTWTVPWLLVAAIALLLAYFVYRYVSRRRRGRRNRTPDREKVTV